MRTIHLDTRIHAPLERCFDLARSIDLHRESMSHTRERAVAGVTGGLISGGESVEWEARHFGWKFRMTVRITEMRSPAYFCDEMIRGPFHSMQHRHYFSSDGEHTVMRDEFEFAAPFGLPGRIVEFILEPYLRKLLLRRNSFISAAAER